MEEIKDKLNKIYNICIEKIKHFINKDNFTKTKAVLVCIFACVFSVICEYTVFRISYPEYISKVRMIIVAIIFAFIGIHFVFKISKMYEFIHKNRYKIACAFLLFVMVFKLSGSSITILNGIVQNQNDDRKYHTILGTPRRIRTDEWATSTTYILSQSQTETPFRYFSDVLRGTDTDMFSVSNSPVADILMLGRPFQIGFILFGNDIGLSFYWYIRLVAMLLGSYELCLILTKRNKKVSLCGMLVITFSAAVQWWYCMDTLIWGQIVVVLIDKFMCTQKKRTKYLCAIGLLVAGLSYVFVFYPAWQVSFGYLFLALVIWILIKNIKYGDYKFTVHDVAVIAITIVCIALLLGRWYCLSKDTLIAEMNTDYPGERQEVGGGALNNYAYFYNIFFPKEEFLNPCEFAAMLSFFPIPMLLGLVYVLRNRKDLHFWIPMLVVAGFLSIWCVYGFPAWLANLTKMSMTTAGRVSIPLGTTCIYMLIYLMGNLEKEDKLLNRKLTYVLAPILTLYIAYKAKSTIGYQDVFSYLNDRFKMLFAGEIFLVAIFGILNINNEKIKNYTIYGLIVIAFMSGLTVNPIISTTNIFYTKPVAIKMNEIKTQEPDALWVVNDYDEAGNGGWHLNDYPVASGIKVLNSTAVYPNLEMFENLLGETAEQKRTIYNRYAHINLRIVDTPTDIELMAADSITIYLNYKDLSKLGVNYIFTKDNLDEEQFSEKFYEEVYSEDNIYIYKVTEGK